MIQDRWVYGVCLVVMAFVSLGAFGETLLVGNLDEPYRADTPIAYPQYWGAQSFLTDADGRLLTSVLAIVGNGMNTPQAVAELRKSEINGEIDTSPAGLLTTFTAPDLSGPRSVRWFTADSPVVLLTAETYWFVLGSSNEGTYDWSYADTYAFAGLGTLGNFADSSDAGATWTSGGNDFPYFIQVNFETPTGACCRGDGSCFDGIDAFSCEVELQGTYLGDGTQCSAGSCCSDPVLVSNLTEPFRASTPIADPEFWGGQSFWIDGNDHVLASIEALVGNGAGAPLVAAELRASDANGEIDTSPGGLLTTFAAPDVSGALSAQTFTPDIAVTLAAGQTYWFLLGASGEGTYDWSYADSNVFTGLGGLGNYADSADAGATWIHRGNDFPYFIQVNVDCSAPATGACCFDSGGGTGGCELLAEADCWGLGGTYLGDGTACGLDNGACDACPDDPEKLAPGECGCGVPDTDSDFDTIADCNDNCPYTVPGSPVDAFGCPPLIRFDFDRDGDVDSLDFVVFRRCGSGPAIAHDGSGDCMRSDADTDADVDSADFAFFQRCYSGEGVAADPDCPRAWGGGLVQRHLCQRHE